MKYFILILLVIFNSTSAIAGELSGIGKIKLFYVSEKGNFVRIEFTQPIKNPANCQKEGIYIAELDDSNGSNRFYSMLLASYQSQKDVSFWVEGCSKYLRKSYGAFLTKARKYLV